MAGMQDEKYLITESSMGRLYLYWEEWSGALFLHLRWWYKDKADGEWKPGKKGIGIPDRLVPGMVAGMAQIAGGMEPVEEEATGIYG
jgi:hypothetical protein